MLEKTPHLTDATALEETTCLEVSRDDIAVLLQRKPLAGMDMLTSLGKQFHASQQLVRLRANRHPNEIIEERLPLANASPMRSSIRRLVDVYHQRFAVVAASTRGVNILLGKNRLGSLSLHSSHLFLSLLGGAAIQAPVIMMSQNRQDTKGSPGGELDFDVNRRAAFRHQGLARSLNLSARR